MPQPSPGDVHVDSLLTNVSVAFVQSADAFIADRVFPRIPVQKQSDKYATYDRGDFLRDEMVLRGPGSPAARSGYRVSNDSYSCDVYALAKAVDDQTVANSDAPFAPMRDATIWVTQKELIKREVDWTSAFFTTGVWTGSTTATDLVAGTDFTAWDNVASTPVEDVHTQMLEIEGNTGFLPNTLVLNRLGWFALQDHPDIVDRVKHVSDGPVTTGIVARLMDLDRIVIAAGVRNTLGEGVALTAAGVSYIAGNHALLAYSTPTPGTMIPTAGYTFVWNGLTGSQDGRRILRYREEPHNDIVEIEAAWDMKVVSSIMGAFFQNVAT